jgi:hypothetical protein
MVEVFRYENRQPGRNYALQGVATMRSVGTQQGVVWGVNNALLGVPTTPCSDREYACLQGIGHMERNQPFPASLFSLLFTQF